MVPPKANNCGQSAVFPVEYKPYVNEHELQDITRLIEKDLSEPYSIFTYRYFIHNWPELCVLARVKGEVVGVIICRKETVRDKLRGYIAMLAVDKRHRKKGIGSALAHEAISKMIEGKCDEVVLETEVTNAGALRLYKNMGFVRDKRLRKYYLNGVDAFRLKLWLS